MARQYWAAPNASYLPRMTWKYKLIRRLMGGLGRRVMLGVKGKQFAIAITTLDGEMIADCYIDPELMSNLIEHAEKVQAQGKLIND